MSEPSNASTATRKRSLNELIQETLTARNNPAQPLDPSSPAAANAALARCNKAYSDAWDAAAEEGKHSITCKSEAQQAFREALPPLVGAQNIRDFIACLAHGMLIGAIRFTDGTRLLYAAQVAFSTVDKRPHRAIQHPSNSPEKRAQSAP